MPNTTREKVSSPQENRSEATGLAKERGRATLINWGN